MAEKMEVTRVEASPGVPEQRDGFDVFQIDITRGGNVILHNFTLPEIEKEIVGQGLMVEWRAAEQNVRIHERDAAKVAQLKTQIETITGRIRDLNYAKDMITKAP